MACLRGCFDKAGDVDEPVVVVAGFVAEPSHWNLAEEEWRKAIGTDDFHMSAVNLREKKASLEALVRIAKRHFRVLLATGVRTDAFEKAKPQLGTSRAWVGDPYRLCCLGCIIAVSEWARKHNEAPVDLVFDKDGKLYNEVSTLYARAAGRPFLREKYKVGNITRGDRKATRGIQLADALAHAVFSFRRDCEARPGLSMGPLLTQLTENIPKEDCWFFTRPEEVIEWAKKLQASTSVG